MGTQTMGSENGGKLQLSKQSSSYNMNLDEFLQNVEPVDVEISFLSSKSSLGKSPNERLSILGEMTLEDYLTKTGVAGSDARQNNAVGNAGDSVVGNGTSGGEQNFPHWLQQQSYVPTQLVNSSQPEGLISAAQPLDRKRVASGDVAKKTVDRRQKRMIKNRESAARSRARKQAYTHELENKVTLLEQENEKLRKQRELDNIIGVAPQPEPKFKHRRTNSALF